MNICVNCKATTQGQLFCTKCGRLQPDVNYFELFGLKEIIEIELQTLQSAYFKLQSTMHPDRFTGKPQAEQQVAMANSAIINNAYTVLSDKFERTQYLVSLHASLDVKVPSDFMALSFSLHENKLEGINIKNDLEVIEAALWRDLEAAQKTEDWDVAALLIAKLKIIARLW